MALFNAFSLNTSKIPEASRWIDVDEKGYLNQLVRILRQNFDGIELYLKSARPVLHNTQYADTTGTYVIDMSVDYYLISSFGGAVTCELPNANSESAIGRVISIKKTDSSANAVTITEDGGSGPDQSSQSLATQYEAITVLSDGNQWFIISKY